MGEASGAEVEPKEVEDEAKVEVTSDKVGDAKDEAKEEEEDNGELAAPEEKTDAAEGHSKVTEWKNSLFKMFSRESADNEATKASTKKEGTEEEQEDEGAGDDGLKTEDDLEQGKKAEGGESKMTNLKKRLSFKAIKSRFSKEKKEEEEEATAEKKNEEGDAKEEVKTDGDEEAITVASDDGAKEMEPPTEATPAVPVQPVAEEDANAKNAQPGEQASEDGTLREIETANADNTDSAVEGAAESLVANTS